MSVEVSFSFSLFFSQVPPVVQGDTSKIYSVWSAQINYHRCLVSGEQDNRAGAAEA
ncbi:MAG: hypothetical protein LBE50_00315 [Gallionellaceae bacterium]|jgi:hypothetical protein|nr:hypothetical protein [Gallionellaceae bacterium]